jgi:hypothetical protein
MGDTEPKTPPEPIILMKRDAIRNNSLKAKLHIDTGLDEATGNTMCGTSKSLKSHIDDRGYPIESEWVGGRFAHHSNKRMALFRGEIASQYHCYTGAGYNQNQWIETLLREESFCKKCFSKWTDEHGAGFIDPIRASIPFQHGFFDGVQDIVFHDDTERYVKYREQHDKDIVFSSTYKVSGEIKTKKHRQEEGELPYYTTEKTIMSIGVGNKEITMNLLTTPNVLINHGDYRKCEYGTQDRLNYTIMTYGMELIEQVKLHPDLAKFESVGDGLKARWKSHRRIVLSEEFINKHLTGVEGGNYDLSNEDSVFDFVSVFLRRYVVGQTFEHLERSELEELNAPTWLKITHFYNYLTKRFVL